MADTAIKVEGLSKRYRIGDEEQQHETLMSGLAAWVKSPLENYRRVKRLSSFGESGAADTIWALVAFFSANRSDSRVDGL